MAPRMTAFLIAAAFTIVIYLVARLLGRGPLTRGADARPSASKAQWWLWTALVIFGYVAVFVERWLRGDPSSGIEVPQNLLLAIGFSGATMAVAKGVTASYVANGLVDKGLRAHATLRGGILSDDDGYVDLVKVQMFAFTAIAMLVYLIRLYTQGDPGRPPVLVDIDPTLMMLTGLSNGGYLGDKIASRGISLDVPRTHQLEGDGCQHRHTVAPEPRTRAHHAP